MNQPIGCCVQAVDACHVAAGDSVLVVGDGSMGLMNAAVYRTLFSLWRSLYPALFAIHFLTPEPDGRVR